MCLNSHICEIHSLDRYSRSVFIGVPPPIAPQKWTRGKGRIMGLARSGNLGSPLILAVLSAAGETTGRGGRNTPLKVPVRANYQADLRSLIRYYHERGRVPRKVPA